ncbi:MAG: c-type cytochrome [Nitrospinaceae bacterium]|nr:cytochrome c [Nitrospinaceae bacterium]NIR53741.1 cytochrome c [Nitrospinaceae bacterium]NIS84149.1 cytochrome c [Nitrospinaceae bacterium]NIT80950.1 cytochrome c [Nitrospinaceae bacterium]NIU43248.1 cytochrome c [Nitrospinaceae bacterium]
MNRKRLSFGPRGFVLFLILAGGILFWSGAAAFHKSIYEPRVPPDQLEKWQEIENPFPPTSEHIDKGRQIYFGKGLCVTCHSNNGKGAKLPGHSPRDFTDEKWQDLRTDGELMWVLKNGSPGTGMPVRVGRVISEEDGWNVIHFIRTFADR